MKQIASRIALSFVLALTIAPAASVPAKEKGQSEWKLVNQEELKQKISSIEKDADAEVLFWERRIQVKGQGAEVSTLIRIKIFTERGRDTQSRVEWISENPKEIKEVAGRTIKPDGTILDLKPDAFHLNKIIQQGKLKLYSTSFVLPGVEPGAIVEYRWKEKNESAAIPLDFQMEIPIRTVTVFLPDWMGRREFNLSGRYTKPEEKGYLGVTMTNVRAFRREPLMPPDIQLRPFLLAHRRPAISSSFFWQMHGQLEYEEIKDRMKVNDEVRKAALSATGDATTQEQKIRRIFDFVRSQIKNLDDDAAAASNRTTIKWKDNKSPADTLRRGMGTNKDINLLFAAMAQAAGFDARYAVTADRAKVFFDPNMKDDFFLDCYNIAVRVGNEWRFFDPSSTDVPYGMLRWREEGQFALLCTPADSTFVRIPLSPPEKSLVKRVANLRLDADGVLVGEARIEYTGHFAAEKKKFFDDESAEAHEKSLRESLTSRLRGAQVTDIGVEHDTDPLKPFVQHYRIRVPNYAQLAGKRLLLPPAFFQSGQTPWFPTSQREHPVYFHYAWMEEDDVTIELPAGFTPEKFEMPYALKGGETIRYETSSKLNEEGLKLHHHRKFVLGMGGNFFFSVQDYAGLKRILESVHQADNQMISLKQGEVVSRTN